MPYYGTSEETYRHFIENIGKDNNKCQDIKLSKSELNKNIRTLTSDLIKCTGKHTKIYRSTVEYDTIILVATDIAEASITIESLKFVIDNGETNKGGYDTKLGYVPPTKISIRETNRI